MRAPNIVFFYGIFCCILQQKEKREKFTAFKLHEKKITAFKLHEKIFSFFCMKKQSKHLWGKMLKNSRKN